MAQVRRGTRNTRLFLLLGTALLVSRTASATDWYVDGLKGGTVAKGTSASPFKYVWQGAAAARPGDTVHLLPTIVYPSIDIQTSGTSGKPITFVGAGTAPNLTRVAGNGAFGFWINAAYVTVSNFDVMASGSYSGIFVNANQHHVTITNNVVHDSGGSGIQTISADYITISHNTVYGNATNTSLAFNSGISTLWNLDIDTNPGTKMIIDGNVVYGNTNTPPCAPAGCSPSTATDSDGNGIIIDDSRRTQRDNIVYHGRTLVSNNVVFGNGGRGIHIYSSDHVTATGNTVFFNNQDPYEGFYRPGEITASYAGDSVIANNVVVADGGGGMANGKYTGTHVPLSVTNCSGNSQIVAQNNLAWDPQNDQVASFSRLNSLPVTISNNSWGNPLFVNGSLNPSIADFRTQPGSPALARANAAMSVATDILGMSRAPVPSVGAFQNAVASVASSRAR